MSDRGIYSIHLSTAKSWRGGENQILLLTRGLLQRKQQVLVLAPNGAPLLDRCRDAGVPCKELTVRGELDLPGTLRLLRLLKKERPDILHLHDGHAVLPGQLAGRISARSKLKVVAHRRTVFKVRGRWKYSGRVDAVIAISEAVKAELLKANVPPASIAVVHSGLDFSDPLPANDMRVSELRRRLEVGDAPIIAHAAALTAEKRQQDLIAALALANQKLKARKAGRVHLVIAGTGDREKDLQQEVRSRGVAECVHFLGFEKDLRPLWAASQMVAFASDAEGLCTALIEAQGAGLPAIVTRAGGMIEVVRDGATGIVVQIGAVEALADAIATLAGDAAMREKFGRAARELVRKKFSADAMVDGTLQLYRRLWADKE